jgi:uncharacterized YkwD family protein/spore coat assembly protein SafA
MNKMKKIFLAFATMIIFSALPAYAAENTYTVSPGDSLWIIANKYYLELDEVIAANPQLQDPDLIYPGDQVAIPTAGKKVQDFAEQVQTLCNKEREKQGIKPLKLGRDITRVAQVKSDDMARGNYFSHQSPTYGSPFDMLKKYGVTYKTAGENIAKGQKTPEMVVASWMKSEGHRKNILNPNFKEMGVGYATGNGTVYWTQIFIG